MSRSGLTNTRAPRFCIHWSVLRLTSRAKHRWTLARLATRWIGQRCETPSEKDLGGNITDMACLEWGNAFASAPSCHSSLQWNNHNTLLVSRSARCKVRFAATCINEPASRFSSESGQ